MKRSEINAIIADSKAFLAKHQFLLPPWAYWGPRDWRGKGEAAAEIVQNMLGWDITDFGSGDFARYGLVLFTLRNGNLARGDKKTYAEKIMIVQENQRTPFHFHWSKMEDIINRGGGNLVIDLYASDETEALKQEPVRIRVDGIERVVAPGGRIILRPGESVCFEQGIYHEFYGEIGQGTVLVGEVSQVNDDAADNRFYKPVGRFPEIEEDEPPLHLLCNEYEAYL